MRKGRQPFRCKYCGRFIADNDLSESVPVDIWPSDPYEPPEPGYAHRSCVDQLRARISASVATNEILRP